MRQSLEITETKSQVWTGMISIANILYNNNMICMYVVLSLLYTVS